ncbi:hypothetical protein [Pseudonocardia sp. TRM90224]|uniref:hypothetical protein n=1 Tax=Pseudonocardia sp. TRM90224 TaxID=2812678 RepID=UPI001E59A0F3|nr:hypothetical protein [Pseudonocardia sp. TRM90224]
MVNLRSTRACVALASALAGLSLLGCGQAQLPFLRSAEGEPVPAEVLAFDPQEYGLPVAALTTEPVRMRVFAGWFGRAEPADTSGPDVVVPQPDHTLSAGTAAAGR